jgi:hypothetical protein
VSLFLEAGLFILSISMLLARPPAARLGARGGRARHAAGAPGAVAGGCGHDRRRISHVHSPASSRVAAR